MRIGEPQLLTQLPSPWQIRTTLTLLWHSTMWLCWSPSPVFPHLLTRPQNTSIFALGPGVWKVDSSWRQEPWQPDAQLQNLALCLQHRRITTVAIEGFVQIQGLHPSKATSDAFSSAAKVVHIWRHLHRWSGPYLVGQVGRFRGKSRTFYNIQAFKA